MPDAIFEARGDGAYMPTIAAQGPWADGLLYGGPVNGLLARALERIADEHTLDVSRLTIDLFRPAPMRPLTVATRIVRRGRRILVADATLLDGEVETARATGLLLKGDAGAAPAGGEGTMPPSPEGLPTTSLGEGMKGGGAGRQGFHTTVQARWLRRRDEGGPVTCWFRLPVPLVAGEEPTALVRMAACADFINAIASSNAKGRPGYINADLTIYFARPPVGEWFCLEVDGRQLGPHALGYSHGSFYDEQGLLGAGQQAVLSQAMQP
jgi:hypothetical protein